MRLLVTGACGFVGSTLVKSLIEHAAPGALEVVGIDNLSRPGSWSHRDGLRRMGVRIVHGDIRNASDLDSLGTVDWVLDAAANASVLAGVDGKASSRQLVEHNLGGTLNLLEYCKASGAGLVLLSSSRVYSIPPLATLGVEVREQAFGPNGSDFPHGISAAGISESFSTAPPVSLYGSTKLASEQMALEYGEAFDFPVWIDRCGVMAGAGQFGTADQGIYSYWLASWHAGRDLRYIGFGGHGWQVRDCLHPRDLVPLLRRQFGTGRDAGMPRIVNLSGGRASAMSLAQLSAWCSQRWGERTVRVDASIRPFDLPWIVLDASLAGKAWGWSAPTTTLQVLEEIAAFVEANPHWLELSH